MELTDEDLKKRLLETDYPNDNELLSGVIQKNPEFRRRRPVDI